MDRAGGLGISLRLRGDGGGTGGGRRGAGVRRARHAVRRAAERCGAAVERQHVPRAPGRGEGPAAGRAERTDAALPLAGAARRARPGGGRVPLSGGKRQDRRARQRPCAESALSFRLGLGPEIRTLGRVAAGVAGRGATGADRRRAVSHRGARRCAGGGALRRRGRGGRRGRDRVRRGRGRAGAGGDGAGRDRQPAAVVAERAGRGVPLSLHRDAARRGGGDRPGDDARRPAHHPRAQRTRCDRRVFRDRGERAAHLHEGRELHPVGQLPRTGHARTLRPAVPRRGRCEHEHAAGVGRGDL